MELHIHAANHAATMEAFLFMVREGALPYSIDSSCLWRRGGGSGRDDWGTAAAWGASWRSGRLEGGGSLGVGE